MNIQGNVRVPENSGLSLTTSDCAQKVVTASIRACQLDGISKFIAERNAERSIKIGSQLTKLHVTGEYRVL